MLQELKIMKIFFQEVFLCRLLGQLLLVGSKGNVVHL